MKKVLALALAICLILSIFVGCGKKQEETTPTKELYEKTEEIPAERIAPKTVTPADSFASGDGSKEHPYEISNAAELAFFASVHNTIDFFDDAQEKKYDKKYYVLTANITINTAEEMAQADTKAPTYGWEQVGLIDNEKKTGMHFSGSLDGKGHTISGLYMITNFDGMSGSQAYLGFFANPWGATIKNLTIADSYYYSYNMLDSIGTFAGQAYKTTLQNCHAKDCRIFGTLASIGGIIGYPSGVATLKDCTASGSIESSHADDVGGITASLSDGTIENCVNNMAVTARKGDAAGICPNVSDTPLDATVESLKGTGKTAIIGCENKGAVVSASRAGGIAANVSAANGEIEITSCTNAGSVKGTQMVGGIVGNAYTTKNTTGMNKVHHGLLTIQKCENKGSVSSDADVGGIVSKIAAGDASQIMLASCKNSGTLQTTGTWGGIVGFVFGDYPFAREDRISEATITIKGCVNDANYEGKATRAGGVIGCFTAIGDDYDRNKISIVKCVNNGNMTSTGAYAVSGFLGDVFCSGDNFSLIFDSCTNNGTLNVTMESASISFAGGFISAVDTHNGKAVKKFVNCVNKGDINVTLKDTKDASSDKEKDPCYCYVGGIAGMAYKETVFDHCSSTGAFNLLSGNKKDIHYDKVCALVPEGDTGFMSQIVEKSEEVHQDDEMIVEENEQSNSQETSQADS